MVLRHEGDRHARETVPDAKAIEEMIVVTSAVLLPILQACWSVESSRQRLP